MAEERERSRQLEESLAALVLARDAPKEESKESTEAERNSGRDYHQQQQQKEEEKEEMESASATWEREFTPMELMQIMLDANRVAPPVLEGLTEKQIKKFIKGYEDYLTLLPEGATPRKMQRGISAADKNLLLAKFKVSEAEWTRLSYEEVIKMICKKLNAPTDDLAYARLKAVPCLRANTYEMIQQLEEDFRYAILFNGEEHPLQERVLRELFVEKIGLEKLRKMVEIGKPQTVQEALDRLRDKSEELIRADLISKGSLAVSDFKIECNYCHKLGHKAAECRKKEADSKTKTSTLGGALKVAEETSQYPTCAYCKKKGHKETECKKKTVVCLKCKGLGHYANECGQQARVLTINVGDSQSSTDGLIRRTLVINGGLSVSALMDTGSLYTLMSATFYEENISMLPALTEFEGQMGTAKLGSSMSIRGRMVIEAMLCLEAYQVDFRKCAVLVVEGLADDFIIGLKDLESKELFQYMENVVKMELSTECDEDNLEQEIFLSVNLVQPITEQQEVEMIDAKFPMLEDLSRLVKTMIPKVFSPLDEEGIKVPAIHLQTKEGHGPILQPSRYVSPDLREQCVTELDKLVQQGRLIKVSTAPRGASALVLVVKPGRTLRLAVDYRELNKVLMMPGGTLLNYEELFPYLRGKQYYAKLDNVQGFHQLRLTEEASWLTVINTPAGLYRWQFLPFGIASAPIIYQQCMESILDGLNKKVCVVFIDDTIVYGDSAEEFLHNLECVLDRLAKFNVKLKAAKCKFGVQKVDFVGHVFSKEGYGMSEERKQSILALPRPQNLKQLRGVLGVFNFFRDFVPNMSALLLPLTSLTKGHEVKTKSHKVPIPWSETLQQQWEAIKLAVSQAHMLGMLEPEGDIYVSTDASQLGVGGMLVQKQRSKDVVICFVSCKFSETAQRWSTIVQECYALVYVVVNLRSLLLGRRFTILTDHRNLLFLMTSQIPKLVRMRLLLLEYDFVIQHIPGVDNVVPDLLSRVNTLTAATDSPREIFLSFHNFIVGHVGRAKTAARIREAGLQWPSINEDVALWVSECPACQKCKSQRPTLNPGPPHTLATRGVMQCIMMDAIGPLPEDAAGNKHILVVIDAFSKFVQLFPCPDVSAMSYLRVAIMHVGLFGLMTELRTDGGSQFTSQLAKDLASWFSFAHVVIAAYHPQANGLVERRNAEIIKHLRIIVMERRVLEEWSLLLPMVQRILNSIVDSSLGTSPARLIFGPDMPIHDNLTVVESGILVTDYVQRLNEQLQLVHGIARQTLDARDEAHRRRQTALDKDKPVKLGPGDYVLLVYPERPPHKLAPVLRGPYIVLEAQRDDLITISNLISNRISTVHISRLRVFHAPSNVNPAELVQWAATDTGELRVQEILNHSGNPRKKSSLKFLIRWEDPEEEDSWEPWSTVRDIAALDAYEIHKGLKF